MYIVCMMQMSITKAWNSWAVCKTNMQKAGAMQQKPKQANKNRSLEMTDGQPG